MAGANGGLASPSFDNQTIVQVLRLSAGGRRMRIRFTNEYGGSPLLIGGARVAILSPEGQIVPGSDRTVTFGGATSAVAPAGAPMLSDPIPLATKNFERLRVSLYLPGRTGPCTCHMRGGELVQVSPPGDWTRRPLPPASGVEAYRAFISRVDVETGLGSSVIVALGDSITDGVSSTIGANRRWPDLLAERLAARFPQQAFGVVNAGIGGNRLLGDGRFSYQGQSALSRLDRDALSVAGASHLLVLEGINDLGRSEGRPTPSELILGYRQLIARARAAGLEVIGATILPFEGAAYFTEQGEASRQAVNAWIRRSGEFDAVVDLDMALRDPDRPARLRADLQSGDWLHPNDAGYRAISDAIDILMLR
ncbi:MAG: SGNH/GDSL hydrolase family protein [Phenylobacterium sp.]|nr:SGNH/GDSL hydrolase family protein [Phenylobacterium sp.]